jgi:ubiquitin C-terminal hydrolase
VGYVDERYFGDQQEDSNEFIPNFIDALLWETGKEEKNKICIWFLKMKKMHI